MEWVEDFYSKQYSWSKTHTNYDMEELRDDLVGKLERLADPKPKKILELGGGNGQFAVAAARQGYEVTVIEIVPACITHTIKLAKKHHVEKNITVIQGDFHHVKLNEQFDLICYWDGFGVGTDSDQQLLVNRIDNWLAPMGTVLVDIYTPWYWANTAGQEMNIDGISRRYDFDAHECRMLDTWWQNQEPDHKITQSLRCYSPADLRVLLKNTELELVDLEPGGAMDYKNWQYKNDVPLVQAMGYTAKFKKMD
ncbi:class I SAM-dependent methyltransferase [Ornithinibacillus salinisoli]|uniref:Class I SAM-dependent methyltransferase n=1 Tax=Ornithinibacillus salinisoli TaxID=1848459 RepID=A0ABW4W1C9_9BACI